MNPITESNDGRWLVSLSGEAHDIEQVGRLCGGLDLELEDRDDEPVLMGSRFDSCTTADQARRAAREAINLLNDVLRIEDDSHVDVKLGGVARIRPDGKREHFLFVTEGARARALVSAPITVGDGSETPPGSSYPCGGAALVACKEMPAVERCLRLWSTQNSWEGWYKIYEMVRADQVGSKVLAEVSKTHKELFTRTANSPASLDLGARHGVQKTLPPPNPMSADQARALIRKLILDWIRALTSAPERDREPE